MTDEIKKIDSDTITVEETKVETTEINVEEVAAKRASLVEEKQKYDEAIAGCDELLAKAATAGVVAD